MTRDELYRHVFHHLAGGMTCRQVTEAMTDYLEGRLGFARWVRFQMHLGLCRGCRIYLSQIKMAVRMMRSLPADPPSAAVRDELLQRFRCWKSA